MAENIITLLNKLSTQIASRELESCQTLQDNSKNEKHFKKCVQRLRQIGCDVLMNKISTQPLEDPCKTEYGGNWNPFILLSDYERELKSKAGGKSIEILHECLEILKDKNYDFINELLKLLLLLQQPDLEVSHQSQIDSSFSSTDFLLGMLDSFSYLSIDFPSDGLSTKMSNKKALQYEESWTRHFGKSFELLGEYSKRNIPNLDKGSVNFLFTCKSNTNKTVSQSSAFVLSDFFIKSNQRQRSLLEVCGNENENMLLDKLVDNPISHKLPGLKFHSRCSAKSGFLEKLSDHHSKMRTWLPKDKKCMIQSEFNSLMSQKSSIIELKRNSNCCHSFSVLYEKSGESKESNCLSEDDMYYSKSKTSIDGSKDIIMGLWEEQHELLREFRPELENCFPKLRMIANREYIEDVKYLCTGINNGTFNLEPERNTFKMVYGTCLQDVTPESLHDFSESFIDMGNSYVRLTARVAEIGKNNFDICRTVSQAFWKSIFDFLELHYTLVLEIPTTINLMALKFSTMDMREMIVTVAEICKVSEPREAFPEGGRLLTYLLHIAEKLSKNCVRSLVFGIIRNCCNVYFMCVLQTWLFQGSTENENPEFFVDYKRPRMKTRTRCYYNSFYIIPEKIPSFLVGFEENVFSCGKSVHFLKLFNLQDGFCQLLDKTDYPSMYPCFTEQDLNKLKTQFEEYEQRAVERCGRYISIKAIREEEKEKERLNFEYIKECKLKEEERRKQQRKMAKEKMKAKRQEQNRQLTESWNEIKAEQKRKKDRIKMEELKAEAKMLARSKKNEKIMMEETELITTYYDEKLGALEKTLRTVEEQKLSLRSILSSSEDSTSEVLDNKIFLDAESNFTNPDLPKEGAETRKVDEENNITEVHSTSNPDIPGEMGNVKIGDENNRAASCSSLLKGKLDLDEENNNMDGASTDQSSISEKISIEEKSSSEGSIFYDVNSNPSFTVQPEVTSDMRKSVSFLTPMEEAKQNKLKVLRSEFDMQTKLEPKKQIVLEKKSGDIMTELERNRAKVLSSEYNILKLSDSNAEWMENILKKPSSQLITQGVKFETINLGRKIKHVNIENVPDRKGVIDETPSFDSLPSEELSEENLRVAETPPQSSIVLNEQYQKALARDAEISQVRLAQQNIFCSLKKEEITKAPFIDFMQFQRYLKKSVLIPLKIQEKLANDAILKQLLEKERLLSHLNSLRGYFFLNDGEFGRSFTHNTFRSLAKCVEPGQFFERSNLSNIVNEALNYTIHNDEPNAQNLSFQIMKMPPFLNHGSHDVLSPFELSYKADWPLNIILTEKALSKYKMVFRFLLKLKRINWTLNENYLLLNSYFKMKKLNREWVRSSHYHKIQIYRHAMTQVMITLDDYIFSNGIQLPWICFLKDLEATENIDHLYQKHVRYMKDVLTRCFLSKDSEELLDCLHNLIEIALKFHYTTKSSTFQLVDGKFIHPKYKVLKLTFTEFCTVIKNFLKMLKEKISTNEVAKSHYVLIEKFDLKLM